MTKDDLKIVFFGTPDFAVESLRAILDKGYNVKAVVTATDKIAGRGHKLLSSAVKNFAVEKGIPILQPQSLKSDEFLAELHHIDADLFIVIAFRMLPESVWTMPRLGTFNLHASLLPKYRGAAPINRAIMNGETKTGVTTFFLKHEIDTGDIIDRVEVDILPDDNAGTLHDKLMTLGAKLTVETIDNIVAGTLKTIPQEEIVASGVEACAAPKIFKETGKIDWNSPANEVHNLIRGLSPYPGAWSVLAETNGQRVELKILRSGLTNRKAEDFPGRLVIEKGRMFVNCKDNLIELLEIQPSGKKRMSADAYLRGARITEGEFVNS